MSRDGQRAGLFLATALAGLALGAIFSVVANYARRLTGMSGPLLAITIAVGGWLAIEAVPFFSSTRPIRRPSEIPTPSTSAHCCGWPP